MSLYDYKPLRWPIEITAANNTIEVHEAGDPVNSAIATLTAGWYLVDGSGTLTVPSDLLAEINTQLATAVATLGLGAPFQVRMGTSGFIEFKGDSGDPVAIDWTLGTFSKTLLGVEDSETSTTAANDAYSSAFRWGWSSGGQFASGIPEIRFTAEAPQHRATESLGYTNNPSLTLHASSSWLEREIEWQNIAAARVFDYRAADLLEAARTGRLADDPGTLNRMDRYLYVGAPGLIADSDAPVYTYTSADPALAVREGPYSVLKGRSSFGLSGINSRSYVLEHGVEVYPFTIVLRRKP